MLLEVSTRGLDGYLLIEVRGELDLSSVPYLRDRMSAILTRPSPGLIADLSGLKFIDSSGVRALLDLQRRVRLLGGTLMLAAPGQAVLRTLQVMGLDGTFAVYLGVAEAAGAARRAAMAPAGDAGQADIVALVVAGRLRTDLRCEALRDAAGSVRAQAALWTELARSIDAHLSAIEEICLLPMLGSGPLAGQRMRAVIADHGDIRELLREARLHPAGSPAWRRLTDEALSCWTRLAEGETSSLLTEFALRADWGLRQRLGRQWLAFLSAWHEDH